MLFKLTSHAVRQYSIRTAISPCGAGGKLLTALAGAEQLSQTQAIERFPITKIKKGDTYYVWHEPRIREDILAVVRQDGVVVTILTLQVYCSLQTTNPLARHMPDGSRLNTWYTKKGG